MREMKIERKRERERKKLRKMECVRDKKTERK